MHLLCRWKFHEVSLAYMNPKCRECASFYAKGETCESRKVRRDTCGEERHPQSAEMHGGMAERGANLALIRNSLGVLFESAYEALLETPSQNRGPVKRLSDFRMETSRSISYPLFAVVKFLSSHQS